MTAFALFKFDSRAEASEALADALAVAAVAALAAGRRARLALSGGSTPGSCYRALAGRDLDWSRVDLALVDDRWVDEDNPGSNCALLRQCFAAATGATVHPMKIGQTGAREAAVALDSAYAALRPFDALVLGMGPDAHTASWFPGSPDLESALDPDTPATVAAIDASMAPVAAPYPWRMSLTLPPVAEVPMVAMLLFGADKRAVLEEALSRDILDAPVRAIVEAAGERFVVFHAD